MLVLGADPLLLRLCTLSRPKRKRRNTSTGMNKSNEHPRSELETPEGHDRRAARLAQVFMSRPTPRPICACRCARSCCRKPPASRRCRSTTHPAPTPTRASPSTWKRACPAPACEWVRERGGVEEYDGRPIKPVDNGNVTGQTSRPRLPDRAQAAARCRRQADHAIRMGARRHRSPRR